MVAFRFHLVSLVAVFLALGVGILIGSTVIDQSIVQRLESNRRTLVNQREAAQEDVRQKEQELARWGDFSEQSRTEFLAERLTDVPVLLVATEGVDGGVIDQARDALRTAGASDRGTLRLTGKFRLEGDTDRADLATALASESRAAASLREETIQSIAQAVVPGDDPAATALPAAPGAGEVPASGGSGPVLLALVEGGFLTYEAPDDTGLDASTAITTGTRVVMISGADAEIEDALLMVPLCEALSAREGAAVVAGEKAPVDDAESTFVAALRDNEELAQRISTIDNLGQFFGDVALVLAVENLAGPTRGHYGIGDDARLLPEPSSE